MYSLLYTLDSLRDVGINKERYDQDYVEDIVPIVNRLVNETNIPYSNNIFEDKPRKLFMHTMPEWRKDISGFYRPESHDITMLIDPDTINNESNLIDTWVHEAQHSKDHAEYGDKYNELFPYKGSLQGDGYYKNILQPGELRAVARVIGQKLRKTRKSMPKDINEDFYKWVAANFTQLELETVGSLWLHSNKELRKDFFKVMEQAMDEGKLTDIESDKNMKDIKNG
jgi:hypothetical protein